MHPVVHTHPYTGPKCLLVSKGECQGINDREPFMDISRRARLAQRLPFYYGWVVFSIVVSTSYTSCPLMSVAVLSVFVVPMTEAFGWSRGLFSGAVSLGGICGDCSGDSEVMVDRTDIPFYPAGPTFF